MRKKLLSFFILTIMLVSVVSAGSREITAYLTDVQIELDGQVLDLKNSTGSKLEPIIYNGTTYLPVRAIGETLNLNVDWNKETRTVLLNSDKKEIITNKPIETDKIETTSKGDLTIDTLGYTILENEGYTNIIYALRATNTNQTHSFTMPQYKITAKDKEENILSTEDSFLPDLLPNTSIYITSNLRYKGTKPASFIVTPKRKQNLIRLFGEQPLTNPNDLILDRVKYIDEDWMDTFTGEITNKSDKNLNTVSIVIIYFKNGKVIGGTSSVVWDVESGETVPFEISDYYNLDFDNYEVHVSSTHY